MHDANGHMTFINDPTEPGMRLAPRFFFGFTASGFTCRFRHDVPTHIRTQLQSLINSKQPPQNLQGPPDYAHEIENILNAHKSIERIWCGPAFHFPEHLRQSDQVVRAQRENLDLFRTTFPFMQNEVDDIQPCMAYIVDGQAVSVCQTVRRSPKAEEAGVDTIESHRGKGYAPLVAAAWAKVVQAQNKMPIYSTSWENQSSQNVAKKLGLIQFGVDYHIT